MNMNPATGQPLKGHVAEAQEAERVEDLRRCGLPVRICYGQAEDGTWQVTEERPPYWREPLVLATARNKALAMHKAMARAEERKRKGAPVEWGEARTQAERREAEEGQ